MILVDKDIKKYVAERQLILTGYLEDNLNGMSYDLTMDVACDQAGNEHKKYELRPGETVFIKTHEKLSIPNNVLGQIAEKNSRMRQGLKVDGPHYQPGHVTYAFLRIQNISVNTITLESGMRVAQIIFEQLTQVPDMPYSTQRGASFQDEVQYRGLGNYKDEYERQTKKEVKQAKEDIEGMSQKIYANVLTLMGILVAVFALLSINYQAFTQAVIDSKYIIVMNLTLTLCIVVMMGLILVFINKAKNKKFLYMYIAILLTLASAVLVMCFRI